jgi:hypothetical protein
MPSSPAPDTQSYDHHMSSGDHDDHNG